MNEELYKIALYTIDRKYLHKNERIFIRSCIKTLYEENQQLKEKVEYLKSKIENKDNWCQLIADIGFDYDGFNQVDSLKSLIDELVKYALYSRDDIDVIIAKNDDGNKTIQEFEFDRYTQTFREKDY